MALVAGTAIARNGVGVLLTGPSGSGKSDLALRAISTPIILPTPSEADSEPDHKGVPFSLISDDQTDVSACGGCLFATSPASIRGQLEVRGVGIIDVSPTVPLPLLLIVELTSGPIERFPEDPRPRREICGIDLAVAQISPFEASAPIKLALMLADAEAATGPAPNPCRET